MLVWPVGTDPHVCLLSNPAQCASSTCLALDTDGQRLLACLPCPSLASSEPFCGTRFHLCDRLACWCGRLESVHMCACLECLRCLKMQMVYSVCTSTALRTESRLRLHKCNIWAALRLAFGSAPLPRVAKKRLRHSCPFAGRLDHLSAAAWVSSPCLMRVLRLPPVPKPDYQPGERTQGPRERESNSQRQGPKHPDVACSPSVFCAFGFL